MTTILSFDWATKKELTVYDSQTDKVKEIPNSIENFEKFLEGLDGEKVIMLFEFGGGDVFKIMAFRAGHSIFQVPGKKIRDFRESQGVKKTDEADAKLIYDFWKENDGGSARPCLDEYFRSDVPSSSENKKGESAGCHMTKFIKALPLSSETKAGGAKSQMDKNLKKHLPARLNNKGEGASPDVRNSTMKLPFPFYPFSESNASLAEIKILFREHEDLKKDMVREKLRRIAFELRFKLARVDDDRVKRILFHKSASIVAKEKEVEQIKKVLEKKVKQFPVWDNYLKGIKGIGPVIAAGLIGELGDKHFDSAESLKHYAGMVAKKDHGDYNRFLKGVLFQFAEQIIKKRTEPWRRLYDDMKVYYQKKHEDWSKGKVNAYAKKFIETKFLLEFWNKNKEGGGAKEVLDKNLILDVPASLFK